MKNNKKCPKCNSTSIARKRGSPVLNSWSRISINLTSLNVLIMRLGLADLNAGYIEEWVENPSDLNSLRHRNVRFQLPPS